MIRPQVVSISFEELLAAGVALHFLEFRMASLFQLVGFRSVAKGKDKKALLAATMPPSSVPKLKHLSATAAQNAARAGYAGGGGAAAGPGRAFTATAADGKTRGFRATAGRVAVGAGVVGGWT